MPNPLSTTVRRWTVLALTSAVLATAGASGALALEHASDSESTSDSVSTGADQSVTQSGAGSDAGSGNGADTQADTQSDFTSTAPVAPSDADQGVTTTSGS